MKTNQIAMMLLAGAALMLSSCENRENDFEEPTFGEDEVAFKSAEVKTRSVAEDQPQVVSLGTITSDDQTFILEDEVTSLDFASPQLETRGTPAFTQNVKDLYGTFYTVALKEDGNAAFAKNTDLKNGVEYTNEKDNIWHYRYGENIWANLPTYFFMRMPGKNDAVTLPDKPYDLTDGSISFSYTSPAAAASQKDILFTSYKRTEKTNAEEITFYHALTGVKFSNYFDNKLKEGANATVETIIKSVKITGVKNTGKCKVTPGEGKTSAQAAVWSDVSGKSNFTITLGDQPNDTTNYVGGSYGLDTLLDKNASARNLNDKNGTLTFWFIPQDLTETATDSVTITVVFDVKLGEETTFSDKELTVNLSKKLTAAHRVWKPGQLHTFTLKPTAVGTEIDDDMDQYVKSDVVVKNTGNVWQYVRVNMVGNWWGNLWEKDVDGEPQYYKDSTILAGYATSDPEDETETEGWNDKDNDVLGYYEDSEGNKISPLYTVGGKDYDMYGKFVNLVAKSTTSDPQVNSHHWVRFDKYYYYTLPIGPGSSVTDTFFDSYTVNPSPEFWIADVFGVRHAAGNVHLIIDLMVQAIEAPMNEAGEETSDYMHAWAAALGYGTNVAALDNL